MALWAQWPRRARGYREYTGIHGNTRRIHGIHGEYTGIHGYTRGIHGIHGNTRNTGNRKETPPQREYTGIPGIPGILGIHGNTGNTRDAVPYLNSRAYGPTGLTISVIRPTALRALLPVFPYSRVFPCIPGIPVIAGFAAGSHKAIRKLQRYTTPAKREYTGIHGNTRNTGIHGNQGNGNTHPSARKAGKRGSYYLR